MRAYLVIWLLIGALPGFGHPVARGHSLSDTFAVARPEGKWIIRGTVADSASNQPVPYASLRLVEAESKRAVIGLTTDVNGQFLVEVRPGITCRLEVSSVGFASKSLPVPPPQADRRTVLTIVMRATAMAIQEVSVRGSKPVVEEQLDRLVYHADRDLTAQGGLATDLLRKVPLVTVLPDGGVSVRGAANVKILVNGRSSVLSNNPAELLRQLPAESIKTIEVITSPSAKYEAEGSTLINIVTKRNLAQGLNATLNGGIGSTGSNAASSLSMNYKKLSLTSGLTGNWFYNPFAADADVYQLRGADRQRVISQQASGTIGIQVMNANAGIEYRLSDKTCLLIGLNHRVRQVRTDRDAQFSTDAGEPTLPAGHYNSLIDSKTNDWNAEYSHTFGKAQQELTVSWTGGVTRNQTVATPAPPTQADIRSQNNEHVFQADYQHPIRRNWLLETGLRFTTRHISNSLTDSLTDHRLTTLRYHQQLAAAYVSSQWDLKKKWSLRTGLRLESTTNDIQQQMDQRNQRYTNLFPTVLVQKRLKNARSVKMAYGLRMQRPPAQLLNSAVATTDPISRYAGNPLLLPEQIHTAELSYSTYMKANSIIMSAFVRHTHQPISPYNALVGTALVTQYVNLAGQTDIGINLYTSVKTGPRWQTIATANLYYAALRGGPGLGNLSNEGANYTLGTLSTYDVSKTWAVQLYGGYNSARIRLQGRDASFSYYQLSVRKSLPQQRGSIALGIDNPLLRRATWISYNEAATFAFRSVAYQYNRGVRLTVIYRIGKSGPRQESAKSRERRQSDLKEDQ
ncbi:outer membrane beta-barrel family protein [Spirosoma humi]